MTGKGAAMNRKSDRLRKIEFVRSFTKHAAGSVLVKWGDTWVLCTASVEEKVPPFLRDTGRGWVTAEYSMLPSSTGGMWYTTRNFYGLLAQLVRALP